MVVIKGQAYPSRPTEPLSPWLAVPALGVAASSVGALKAKFHGEWSPEVRSIARPGSRTGPTATPGMSAPLRVGSCERTVLKAPGHLYVPEPPLKHPSLASNISLRAVTKRRGPPVGAGSAWVPADTKEIQMMSVLVTRRRRSSALVSSRRPCLLKRICHFVDAHPEGVGQTD